MWKETRTGVEIAVGQVGGIFISCVGLEHGKRGGVMAS